MDFSYNASDKTELGLESRRGLQTDVPVKREINPVCLPPVYVQSRQEEIWISPNFI